MGRNTQEKWAENLIAKEGLVLASAPYIPMNAIFFRVRNILFQISLGAYLEEENMPPS